MFILRRNSSKPLFSAILAVAFALGIGASPAFAAGGLLGKHVDISLGTVESDSFSATVSSQVLVHEPGLEAANFGQIFNVDFTASGLRLDVVGLADPLILPSMVFVGLVASNFEGHTLAGLTSGDTNIVGFETLTEPLGSRLQMGNQFLAFNFEGLTLRNGDFVEVGLNLVSNVDEPAGYALLLAGLGTLGMLARRRQR